VDKKYPLSAADIALKNGIKISYFRNSTLYVSIIYRGWLKVMVSLSKNKGISLKRS